MEQHDTRVLDSFTPKARDKPGLRVLGNSGRWGETRRILMSEVLHCVQWQVPEASLVAYPVSGMVNKCQGTRVKRAVNGGIK